MSLGVFYFRDRNIPISILPEAYSIFVNNENKTTKIPAAFPREGPLLFFFFFTKRQARSRAWLCLDGGSHYHGQLSLAPQETLLKVSWDGFRGATPDRAGGTWALSHYLAKSWSRKRQKSERCWRERQMSHRQGTYHLLWRTSPGKPLKWEKRCLGKTSTHFWSGPFNTKKTFKGCFCSQQFLKYLALTL